MDFDISPRALELSLRLEAFMERYVLPYNAAWHQSVLKGIYPPIFLEDLKTLAQEEGLWNLFMPKAETGGRGLANLDYAPLAEIMGRIPWAAEVFNCSAPDTGNMELLHRFASPMQRERWLAPLLAGEIRSAFAMTEPDVGSSDPTNLRASVKRIGDQLVLNGRKWFITGAAHPRCEVLLVMCRNTEEPTHLSHEIVDFLHTNAHHQHSIVLVPIRQIGLEIVRNISVVHNHAPEGHCEIVFRNVHVPVENLLGHWGDGFGMAQARLGPGRIHHCMRTIGQCALALEMATQRAIERKTFGHYLSDYANIQQWIADSRIEIDQARLLVQRVAWLLDSNNKDLSLIRAQIAMIKVVAARLQTSVVDRAMQIFGAMGLSPDTPLAYFWTWGRAMHLMDGPDEVHLRTIARHEFAKAHTHQGSTAAYFTTPEQMQKEPRIR